MGVDPRLAALQNLHTAHSSKHSGVGLQPDKVAHAGDCMQPDAARQAPSAGGFAGSARMRYAVVSCRWEERWLTLLLLCCKENLSMATTLEAMVAAAKAAVPALTADQVHAKLQAGEQFVILDVREKEEYDQGHIAQAKLLPRGLLEIRIGDVVPNKSTNILLH